MLFNLIGTITIGVAAAGIFLILNRLLKGALPRWLMPLCAGLSMFSFHVWNDYSWYARNTKGLPNTILIAKTYEESSPFKPWTFIVPRTDRFVSFDRTKVKPIAEGSKIVGVELILSSRFQDTSTALQLFDCAGNRQALFPKNLQLNADNTPKGVDWAPIPAGHKVLRSVCKAGLPNQ